jgi:hypothetical protein
VAPQQNINQDNRQCYMLFRKVRKVRRKVPRPNDTQKKLQWQLIPGYPDQNVWDYVDDHFYGIDYASESEPEHRCCSVVD